MLVNAFHFKSMVASREELSSETPAASIIRDIVRTAIQNVEKTQVNTKREACLLHSPSKKESCCVAVNRHEQAVQQEEPLARSRKCASGDVSVSAPYDGWPCGAAAFAAAAWASLVCPQPMHTDEGHISSLSGDNATTCHVRHGHYIDGNAVDCVAPFARIICRSGVRHAGHGKPATPASWRLRITCQRAL